MHVESQMSVFPNKTTINKAICSSIHIHTHTQSLTKFLPTEERHVGTCPHTAELQGVGLGRVKSCEIKKSSLSKQRRDSPDVLKSLRTHNVGTIYKQRKAVTKFRVPGERGVRAETLNPARGPLT